MFTIMDRFLTYLSKFCCYFSKKNVPISLPSQQVEELITYVSSLPPNTPPIKRLTFTNAYIQIQFFDLPKPCMHYILKNANDESMKKFLRSCKYFYNKNPYFIIDRICVKNDGKIILAVVNNILEFDNFSEMDAIDNIWITNEVDFNYDGENIEKILSKIVRVDAKKIFCKIPSISFPQFSLLTKSKFVEEWVSESSDIFGIDGNIISLEELLFYLPNGKSVCAKIQGISRNTFISLPMTNKISYLRIKVYLKFIDNNKLFCEILKRSLASKAMIEMDFRSSLTGQMDSEFNNKIMNNLKATTTDFNKSQNIGFIKFKFIERYRGRSFIDYLYLGNE